MLIVTTDHIPNASAAEAKGAVCSEQVAAINVARDVVNWAKSLLGGRPTPIPRNIPGCAGRRWRIWNGRPRPWGLMPSSI